MSGTQAASGAAARAEGAPAAAPPVAPSGLPQQESRRPTQVSGAKAAASADDRYSLLSNRRLLRASYDQARTYYRAAIARGLAVEASAPVEARTPGGEGTSEAPKSVYEVARSRAAYEAAKAKAEYEVAEAKALCVAAKAGVQLEAEAKAKIASAEFEAAKALLERPKPKHSARQKRGQKLRQPEPEPEPAMAASDKIAVDVVAALGGARLRTMKGLFPNRAHRNAVWGRLF